VAILATNSIQGLRFVDEMGQSVPLHVTAAGKALLAFGPESPADAVKGLGRLERLTERTMSTRSTLLRDLKESVARGFTVCDEEREQGVRAIGVPILDDRGVARAAVGIQGPIFRIPDARIPELADILGMAAKECSARSTWTAWPDR